MNAESHNLPFITRQSPISGMGNFAIKDIPKGQTIGIMTGEVMGGDELTIRVEEDQLSWDDDLQIGANRYMILDQPWMSINHSCNPNCGAENCRGVIGSILTISKPQLHYYIESGALLDFILEELKNSNPITT